MLYIVPLNTLMKMQTAAIKDFIGVGYITVGGEAKTAAAAGDSSEDESVEEGDETEKEEMDADVSFGVEDLKYGGIKLIICHAESLHTKSGGAILEYLSTNGLILSIIIDEAHKFLHWKEIRPQMYSIVPFLRHKAPNVSVVLLTATILHRRHILLFKTLCVLFRERPILDCSGLLIVDWG